MRRYGLIGLLAMIMIVIAAPTASAHRGDQSYLYLDITESVHVELHMPFIDLAAHADIVIDGDDAQIDEAIERHASALISFARDHFEIGSAQQVWELGGAEAFRLENNDYVIVRFSLDLEPDDVPADLVVTLDPFFDEDDERDALFLIANDWERGFVNNEADPLERFTASERTQQVDIGDRSWTRNLTSSIELGVDHIKTGPDHILFVAVLLLPSVLVFNRRWKPTGGFGRSLWRVLKVVSMFTLAHSITFTLAGLSIIPLPGSRFVETIIALSIAAAAVHNLRPIAPEREWLIAFAFGLFHGLGFASLVEDLQIPRSTQLVSLIGRNLGIEIGQAAVVLLVFPALFLLRRTRFYMPFFRTASIVLVIVSLGWMTERLFDAPQIATTAVDAVIGWPRALVVIVVFTALAAAAWFYERQNGSLLDVDDDGADDIVRATLSGSAAR